MRFTLLLLALSCIVQIPVQSSAQDLIDAYQVDYRIEIEAGRDPNRPEVRQEPIIVINRMYIFKDRAVYVQFDSTKQWSDYSDQQKTVIWKKGKTSYKYSYKDSNCCILYSSMKNRYRHESTVVVDKIIGRNAKKTIVYDDVNRRTYLVWTDPNIATSISPIGFLPVSGLVLRLRNENVVYEVQAIKKVKVDPNFFKVNEDGYRFSESAFRRGIIE